MEDRGRGCSVQSTYIMTRKVKSASGVVREETSIDEHVEIVRR